MVGGKVSWVFNFGPFKVSSVLSHDVVTARLEGNPLSMLLPGVEVAVALDLNEVPKQILAAIGAQCCVNSLRSRGVEGMDICVQVRHQNGFGVREPVKGLC